MKLFSKFAAVILFVFYIFSSSSCSNTVTYAEELKAERELIADYIARNNIKVVTEEPTVWGDSVYWLTDSGLYFHLVDSGDTSEDADTIEANDLIVPRFYQYTLDSATDTISNWNTVDYPYPTTFNYLDDTQACTAWHEAVSYMKRNDSEAKIIVFSKIGFSSDQSSVTPYGYHLKIKFQK